MHRFMLISLVLMWTVVSTSCTEYGNYLDKGIGTIDQAKKLTAELNARTVMQEFQMKQGRTPNSLDELKRFAGQRMPVAPKGSHWEFEGGRLTLVIEKR